MHSTPFIIDQNIEQSLKSLVELANQPDRRISLHTLKEASIGFNPNDPKTRKTSIYPPDQTITLPLGWKLTISIEEQPYGWCWHLSMSSPQLGKVPAPETVQMIIDTCGFNCKLNECFIYPETYQTGRVAINVINSLENTGPWKNNYERM